MMLNNMLNFLAIPVRDRKVSWESDEMTDFGLPQRIAYIFRLWTWRVTLQLCYSRNKHHSCVISEIFYLDRSSISTTIVIPNNIETDRFAGTQLLSDSDDLHLFHS
jgi:hypothetical protein